MELTAHIALPELTALATRDENFAALVARQSRFVFRVAYSVLRNAQDAEDVVQDTFFKLHRSGAWQQMQDERAFLARAAWRLAVDRIPKARLVHQPEPAPQPESVPSHEQSIIDRDLQATVHRLIDALPEELRQPLVLSAIDELTSREIGAVLGVPEGTVRTRLMRARQILRERLAVRMGGPV